MASGAVAGLGGGLLGSPAEPDATAFGVVRFCGELRDAVAAEDALPSRLRPGNRAPTLAFGPVLRSAMGWGKASACGNAFRICSGVTADLRSAASCASVC